MPFSNGRGILPEEDTYILRRMAHIRSGKGGDEEACSKGQLRTPQSFMIGLIAEDLLRAVELF